MKKSIFFLILSAFSLINNVVAQNTLGLPSGDLGLGVNPAENRLHVKGSEGFLVKLEGQSFSGLNIKAGTASKMLGLHFLTDGPAAFNTNSLRFGRYSITGDKWGTGWEANPIIFDLDAPDGTLAVDETGRIGIGKLFPDAKLDINTTASVDGLQIKHNGGSFVRLHSTSLGEAAFNGLTRAGDAGIVFGGGANPGDLSFGFIIAPWRTEGSGIRIDNTGNVGIGTYQTNNSDYKLFVEKGIRTRKIRVDQSGWADYVFHPTYRLRPLSEVEQYIQQYHHLPDVPSAAEVEKEGLDLGDNQAMLLKKIEELTLYIIQQQKEIEGLKKEIKTIKQAGK